LEQRFDVQQTAFASLVQEVQPVLDAIEKQRKDAIAVSKNLDISLIAFMDSDEERNLIKHWVEKTEERIGVGNLEDFINKVDIFHPFGADVFVVIGHYHRFRAKQVTSTDFKVHHLNRARSFYRRALKDTEIEEMTKSRVLGCLAICCYSVGDFAKGLEHTEEAMSVQTRVRESIDSILHEQKGFCLMNLGRDRGLIDNFKQAEKEYRASLILTENKHRVYYNLACNHALWGDLLINENLTHAATERYATALSWLEKIPLDAEIGGENIRETASKDADLERLRAHPTFKERFDKWLNSGDR
jgi:tetratricopeptide (TPR) repeat protein